MGHEAGVARGARRCMLPSNATGEAVPKERPPRAVFPPVRALFRMHILKMPASSGSVGSGRYFVCCVRSPIQ